LTFLPFQMMMSHGKFDVWCLTPSRSVGFDEVHSFISNCNFKSFCS
jgi:hypothetical protein